MAGSEAAEVERLRANGMTIALHAREAPDRLAILSPAGDLTYGELNAKANQLVRALPWRAALVAGLLASLRDPSA